MAKWEEAAVIDAPKTQGWQSAPVIEQTPEDLAINKAAKEEAARGYPFWYNNPTEISKRAGKVYDTATQNNLSLPEAEALHNKFDNPQMNVDTTSFAGKVYQKIKDVIPPLPIPEGISYENLIGHPLKVAHDLADRFKAGLYNGLIAEPLHQLGKSDNEADVVAYTIQQKRIATRQAKGEQPLTDAWLNDEYNDIRKQLDLPPEARESEDTRIKFTAKPETGNPYAAFLPPAEETGGAGTQLASKGIDALAGIAAFTVQVESLGVVAPSLSPAIRWEMVNTANGGAPGGGAAMQIALGKITKTIPAAGVVPAIARGAAGSVLFGTTTYLGGGSTEDILINMGIPFAFEGLNISKQSWKGYQKKAEFVAVLREKAPALKEKSDAEIIQTIDELAPQAVEKPSGLPVEAKSTEKAVIMPETPAPSAEQAIPEYDKLRQDVQAIITKQTGNKAILIGKLSNVLISKGYGEDFVYGNISKVLGDMSTEGLINTGKDAQGLIIYSTKYKRDLAEQATQEAGKQPWEMTKEEFGNALENRQYGVFSYSRDKPFVLTEPPPLNKGEKLFGNEFDKVVVGGKVKKIDAQKRYIEQALSEGKPVPPEVLAEYPDLKPTGGKQGERQTDLLGRPETQGGASGKQRDLLNIEQIYRDSVPPTDVPTKVVLQNAVAKALNEDAQKILNSRMKYKGVKNEQQLYDKIFVNQKELFIDPSNPIPEMRAAWTIAVKGKGLFGNIDFVTKEPVKNTVFTEERYEKAKDFLIRGSTQGNLFSGVDPRGIKALIEVGGYHFEKGLREFKAWSVKMIEEFGEKVRPHLKKIWNRLTPDIDKIARRDNLKKVEEEIKQHDLYKDTVSERQGRHGYLVGGVYRIGDNMWGDVKVFLESHPELKGNLIKESDYLANREKYKGVGAWDTALKELAAAERNPEMEQGGLDTFLNELARRTTGRSKMGRGGIDETDLEATIQKGKEGFNLLADKRRWLQEGRTIDEINKDIREYVEGMGGNEADVKRELLDKSAQDVAPREPGQELKTKAGKELDALISNEMQKAAALLPVFTGNIDKAMAEIVRLKKVIGESKELVYEPQRKKIKALEREIVRQQKKIDEVKTRRDERIAKIREQVNARIKGRMETVKRNLDIRHQTELREMRIRLDRLKEALTQRTTTVQQARNSIKAIMKKLPMEVDTRVDEITDPAEYVKLIEEIKQKVRAKPIRELRAEELDRIDYETLKAEPYSLAEGAMTTKEKVVGSVKTTFESLSSRAKAVALKVAARVRKLEHEKAVAINEDTETIRDWIEGFNKLSADEKVTFSVALGNKNIGTVNKFLDEYDLRDAYENMQAAKESIRQEAIDAGIDVPYLEEHYPRYIKDFTKYIEDYNRYWDEQVKRHEEKTGRTITPDEEAALANRLLTTKRFGISTTPGSAKHREMEFIPPELVKHYTLADESIDRYIYDMRDKIFKAKLLGKEPEAVQKVRRQLSNLYTRFAKLDDYDPAKLEMGREIVEKQDWLDSRISDTRESVGRIAVEAIKAGELNSKDAVELQKVLTTLLEPENPKGAVISNLISMDTLNMVTTSLSQMQGQPAALARHPAIYAQTIMGILKRSILKLAGSNEPIFRYVLGDVAQNQLTRDMYEQQSWRKGKKVLMFAIAKADRFDANIDLEQFYNEFRSAARKGKDNADTEYLKKIFDGDEYRQVLADFKAERKTTLTKLAIYNRLADVRLLSKFEQSEGFTKAGTAGKLFYKFKTAQTKMVNWWYEESIRNINSGNPILIKEGYKNLIRIPIAMLAANIAVNVVQDWLKGREIDMWDITFDSALQMLPFVNRYAAQRFRKEGLPGFISAIIPVGRTPEAIRRAITTGQPEQLLKAVPWVGDILYGQTDVAKMNDAFYSAKDITDNLKKKIEDGTASSEEEEKYGNAHQLQSLIRAWKKAETPEDKQYYKDEIDNILATKF